MADDISVATYSFRHDIKEKGPNKGYPGFIELLKKNDIKFVEINNTLVDPAKFSETVKLFTDAGIKPIMLTIDGNNFFQKTEMGRKNQLKFMKKWIDLAESASIEYLRANMGRSLGKLFRSDSLENLVKTFRPILEYAESKGMKFTFENHGGKSSNVNFQLKVKEQFPSPNMGYLVDFGNYKPRSSIYENILKLDKSILIVHAKTHEFKPDGEEADLDFKKIIENLRKVGYHGYYSIEAEGSLPDVEGIEKTIALLRKYL